MQPRSVYSQIAGTGSYLPDKIVTNADLEKHAIIMKGIEVSEFSRKRMDATLKELHEERDGVKHLLGK